MYKQKKYLHNTHNPLKPSKIIYKYNLIKYNKYLNQKERIKTTTNN